MGDFQSQIEETKLKLYSGQRDELNILSPAVDNATTTFTLVNSLGGIRIGAVLAVDTELVLVRAVSGQNATVVRGYFGSAKAAHVVNSLVWVNPKFSDHAIFQAIKEELHDISSPQNGLFKMVTSSALVKDSEGQYAFAPADLISIYDIRADADFGPYANSPVKHYDHTGTVIRVPHEPAPSEITVRYKAKYTQPAATTDDVKVVSGLHDEAHDILPLGAALRLVGFREVKRGFTEAQTDSRRADEVPPGTTLRAAQMLAALRTDRVAAEAARLNALYPPLGA